MKPSRALDIKAWLMNSINAKNNKSPPIGRLFAKKQGFYPAFLMKNEELRIKNCEKYFINLGCGF